MPAAALDGATGLLTPSAVQALVCALTAAISRICPLCTLNLTSAEAVGTGAVVFNSRGLLAGNVAPTLNARYIVGGGGGANGAQEAAVVAATTPNFFIAVLNSSLQRSFGSADVWAQSPAAALSGATGAPPGGGGGSGGNVSSSGTSGGDSESIGLIAGTCAGVAILCLVCWAVAAQWWRRRRRRRRESKAVGTSPGPATPERVDISIYAENELGLPPQANGPISTARSATPTAGLQLRSAPGAASDAPVAVAAAAAPPPTALADSGSGDGTLSKAAYTDIRAMEGAATGGCVGFSPLFSRALDEPATGPPTGCSPPPLQLNSHPFSLPIFPRSF